jgi:hypothetical protein
MAADKEIMKALERLRLDRPSRTYQAAHAGLGDNFADALRELAATYREEAELWSRSGAKGWKSKETESYVIATAIDGVAAQLDNAGDDQPQREPFIPTEPATTHERLDDFVASAVAAGKGTLRLNDLPVVSVEINGTDVTAYLKGEIDTLPGGPMSPGSVHSLADLRAAEPEHIEPLATERVAEDLGVPLTLVGEPGPELVLAASIPGITGPTAEALMAALPDTTVPKMPYCRTCDLDQHRCPGCGEPTDHAESACAACNRLYATVEPVAVVDNPRVNMTNGDWNAPTMPSTWESDTMTSDGLRPPGTAPTLGQPGDMGTGYSHSFIPPGGRKITYAELLAPVPAASLPPHLSHSQGNDIGDCATKYRLQRVEQLPQIPQWANIGGSAFHAAVEAFERTVHGMPGALAAQDAGWKSYDCETVWAHHFDGQIQAVAMTTPVPQSMWRASRKGAEGEQWWRVNGPLMLRRYLDARPTDVTWQVTDAVGTPGPIAIELDRTIDVPTPYGPIPFKAQLDRVTISDDGRTLTILDYKTSYDRPSDTTQLGDYAWVLAFAFPDLVAAGVKILGSYFDARRGTWTEPVDLLQAHPFEAFQYKRTTDHAQKLALTTGPTPARKSNYCGGCAVRYACPIMATKS